MTRRERRKLEMRARILDVGALRDAMPGVERWISHETAYYSGAREGTFWALLALAVWYASLDGVAPPPARSSARSVGPQQVHGAPGDLA